MSVVAVYLFAPGNGMGNFLSYHGEKTGRRFAFRLEMDLAYRGGAVEVDIATIRPTCAGRAREIPTCSMLAIA